MKVVTEIRQYQYDLLVHKFLAHAAGVKRSTLRAALSDCNIRLKKYS